MTLIDIMNANVQTVKPGMPAANARARMREKKIHHLVVEEGDAVVGVVSARDLGRAARLGREPKKLTVADFMTPRVVTAEPGTSLHRAANLMRGHSIGCLIVIDEGRAAGIVTVADVLDHVSSRQRHRAVRQARPDLRFRVAHKKQHRTGGAW
jgi:CBS domain-containing protein